MKEERIRFYLTIFTGDMIEVFGKMYLNRRPNKDERDEEHCGRNMQRLVSQDVQVRSIV